MVDGRISGVTQPDEGRVEAGAALRGGGWVVCRSGQREIARRGCNSQGVAEELTGVQGSLVSWMVVVWPSLHRICACVDGGLSLFRPLQLAGGIDWAAAAYTPPPLPDFLRSGPGSSAVPSVQHCTFHATACLPGSLQRVATRGEQSGQKHLQSDGTCNMHGSNPSIFLAFASFPFTLLLFLLLRIN